MSEVSNALPKRTVARPCAQHMRSLVGEASVGVAGHLTPRGITSERWLEASTPRHATGFLTAKESVAAKDDWSKARPMRLQHADSRRARRRESASR